MERDRKGVRLKPRTATTQLESELQLGTNAGWSSLVELITGDRRTEGVAHADSG